MRDVTAREHMSMFFSILIPAYNCERYIDDCINSIMKQSCNDFEVIIINDVRLYGRANQYSTTEAHMPPNHRQYSQWNGERFRRWRARLARTRVWWFPPYCPATRWSSRDIRAAWGD